MPDPPMFEGSEGNIDFEDWLIRITSILQANADHWPTDSARLTFWTAPPKSTATPMLDRLTEVYRDPNERQTARAELDGLKMTEKEDFHKFVTKFMHTAQKAQLSTRDYVYDFKKRLPYRLQTHLAATPVDVPFQQFTHTAAGV
ncbi:hypothetical protein E4U15_002003 [Claviceps sp. LM218 group G6]|nr:hypothetical protein E4U15_002003 [Claviceps sp. LM218 group G6]